MYICAAAAAFLDQLINEAYAVHVSSCEMLHVYFIILYEI